MSTNPITVQQYESFKGFPGLRDELIYGEIIMSPQAKPMHQQICKNLLYSLDEVLKGGSFVAQMNTNVKFENAHSMPAPDVFVVSRAAWNAACLKGEYLSEPPLLAIEVISPANKAAAVRKKLRLYLDNGVNFVWVVLPKKQRVISYTSDEKTEHSVGEQVLLPPPIRGFLQVYDLFRLDI